MAYQQLTKVFAEAGIGGLSLAVFLLLFHDAIRRNIFPKLPAVYAFRLIRQFMYLTFVIATVGICAGVVPPNLHTAVAPAINTHRSEVATTPAHTPGVGATVPTSQATLAAASITFHTGDQGKNPTTPVTVSIDGAHGESVAVLKNVTGHFVRHTDDGPINLDVQSKASEAEIQNWTVRVAMDLGPGQKDHWKVAYTIELTFSDGNKITKQFGAVELRAKNAVVKTPMAA